MNTYINTKFLQKYPWAKTMQEQDWSNAKVYIDPDNTTVKKRQKIYDLNISDTIPMELVKVEEEITPVALDFGPPKLVRQTTYCVVNGLKIYNGCPSGNRVKK